MDPEFLKLLFERHNRKERYPASNLVCDFTTTVLEYLFPEMSTKAYPNPNDLEKEYEHIKILLKQLLAEMADKLSARSDLLVDNFMLKLPSVYYTLQTDVLAIIQGDPAARDEFEVVRAYPGFYAIAMYRIAHELHKLKVPVIPRIITESAHGQTGIDIHPGAEIGAYFCIDHGTGVVIGETSKIGEYVKIYQGVTLGALSVDKSMAEKKRHPTLEHHVVVYAGATILGGETIIGSHCIIGGNVWVTKSVPAHSTLYYKAQIDINQYRSDDNVINPEK